jgi:hypothetical protein
MPLPPLTKDYFTVGGAQVFGVTLFTWGQARSPVYAAQHTTGGFSWSNFTHAYDYYNFGPGSAIRAADAQGRLFRGTPFAAPGYNDYATFSGGSPPAIEERFFFGGLYEDPLNPGLFLPSVSTGLDKDYESAILTGAFYAGTTSSVTVGATAFDGSDPFGQNIGPTPTGDITAVTLAF